RRVSSVACGAPRGSPATLAVVPGRRQWPESRGRALWATAVAMRRPCQNRNKKHGATMKEKDQIVENWLPRYTGVPLDGFGEHILLTNFGGYLGHFARLTGAAIVGTDRPMPSATADGITMINF